MTTIRTGLPIAPAVTLNKDTLQAHQNAAAAVAEAQAHEPVQVDMRIFLASQTLVEPGKLVKSQFDIKQLDFDKLAGQALGQLETIKRLRPNAGDAGVVLQIGSTQIMISADQLNKESLAKALQTTLASMSPEDIQAAIELSDLARPVIAAMTSAAMAPKGPVPSPATEPKATEASPEPIAKAPETWEELFKSEYETPEAFGKYCRGFLEGKLGVKSVDAGFIASYLYDALKGDTVGKRVRGLGFVIVRLHELSQRDPKVKDALNKLIAQVESSIPAKLHPIFKKMFTLKGPSLGHIANLYTVTDGKFETAKDIYAAFELVHHFGPEVKAFLPPSAQRYIERMEALLGKEFSSSIGKIVKKFIPMGLNSDFSIALCKIAAGDTTARLAGALDIAKLMGIKLFGDGGQFSSLMSFAKIDIDTTVYVRQLLDPANPPELKAKALKNIVEIYQTRLDKFAKAFPPGTIPAGVYQEAEKLIALVPSNPVELAAKLKSYGLSNPEDISKALESAKKLGVETQEDLLVAFQKTGFGQAKEALAALDKAAELGIKSIAELGETYRKMGVKDFAGLDKSLKELSAYGVKQASEAVALLESLSAKNSSEALELLSKLGVKPGKLSLEALGELGSKTLAQFKPYGVSQAADLLDLLQHTGTSNIDKALELLGKQGIQAGEAGAEALVKLGLQNAAQATRLLDHLGVKTLAEAEKGLADFAAHGLGKGDDLLKALSTMGLSGSKDAAKLLSILQLTGVSAADAATSTIDNLKGLGLRYIDRFGKDFAALQKFGVSNLTQAAEVARLFGNLPFDTLSEGFERLGKFGVNHLDQAKAVMAALGSSVKNIDEAVMALGKLSGFGLKNADDVITAMKALEGIGIKGLDQVLEFSGKLGLSHLNDLLKFQPLFARLAELGVDTGPALVDFVTVMGARNLDKAVKVLEALQKAGISDGKQAIEIAKKLGLEKTGRLASVLEALPFSSNKVERLLSNLKSVGIDSLEKAIEMLDKTGIGKADELIDLFKKFDILNAKDLEFMMENFGCKGDPAKLGSTLKFLAQAGISNAADAIKYAAKLGMHNVADAAELMAKFSKAGLPQIDEVLKVAEKLGLDLSDKTPAVIKANLETALNFAEEAAKYGVKGIDDLAETIAKTGAKNVTDLASKMSGRAGIVNTMAKALGLSDEASGALIKLMQNGHMSDEVAQNAMSVMKSLGRENAEMLSKVLAHMQPDLVAGLFKYPTVAKALLEGMTVVVPRLTALGIGAAQIGAKLGKGILKALPALGAAVSAADTLRTKAIAQSGQWTEIGLKGFGKTIQYNADARGLAAIAGAFNAVDTALGVAEILAPGLGPIVTAAPQIGLALAEVALDVMIDYYNENPMPAQMKNVVEAAAYATCAATLDVPTIIALNQSYGKAAEHSGQIMAQWLSDGKHSAQDIEHAISELSKSWTRNDDATRSLFKALEEKDISLSSLVKKSPPVLTQKSLEMLFKNLDSCMTFKSSDDDYQSMRDIAAIADTTLRARMINSLMDQHTNDNEEKIIFDILKKASADDFELIISRVNIGKLAGELENKQQFEAVFERITQLEDDTVLRQFVKSKDISATQISQALQPLLDKGAKLSDSQRAILFAALSKSGDAQMLKTLLMGNAKLNPISSPEMQKKMIGQIAERMADFIAVFGNEPQAGADVAVMVMLYGSPAQIDSAFKQINQHQWFGNGSEIIREAIDQAKARGIDLKGKVSHDTLKNMLGSLNNGWTKTLRLAGGSEHKQAEKYILELARISSPESKAEIIKDLMKGWTPGSYESMVQSILLETKDPREFSAVINQLNPAELSSELEDRKELGVVMACILERYQGDGSAVLQKIMHQWSNMSVQSDDILYHMLKQLEKDGKLDALKQLPNAVLDEMIDWTDDSFRDGNVTHLDAESHWSINLLQAAKVSH